MLCPPKLLLLLYAWGEPYLVSGERCRSFRAHVVIATDLVGAQETLHLRSRLISNADFEEPLSYYRVPGRAHSLL